MAFKTDKLIVDGDIQFDGSLFQQGGEFSSGYWTELGNGNAIQYTDGSVGIGVAPSNRKLRVNESLLVDNAGDIFFEVNFNTFKLGDVAGLADGLYIESDGTDFHIKQDTTNLVTVYDSGEMGIGKAPSGTYKLDVNGDLNIDGSIFQNGVLFEGDGGTSYWTQTGANIHYDSGNVGIYTGVSAPARELEVTGTGNVYIRITAPTANDWSALELTNTNETWQIINDDTLSDSLRFHSDTFDAMTIRPEGSIGFGTTNPIKIMHLHNTDPTFRLSNTTLNSVNSGTIEFAEESDSVNEPRVQLTYNGSNNNFYIKTGSGSLSNAMTIARDTQGVTFANDVTAGSSFQAPTLIASTQIYLPDANTKLEEGANNVLRVTTNSGYIDIGPQNTSYAHIYTDRGSFYFNKGAYFSGPLYTTGTAAHDLGTWSNMWGDIYADNFRTRTTTSSGGNAKGLSFNNFSGDTTQGVYGAMFSDGSLSYLYIGKAYNDTCLKIYPDGETQLSYNNSTTLATKSGAVEVTGKVVSKVSGGDVGRFEGGPDGNDYIEIDGGAGDYIKLITNGTTGLWQDSGGLLGTGIDPSYKLHVSNTANATDNPALYVTNANGYGTGAWNTGAKIVEFVGDSDSIALYNFNSGDYWFGNTQQGNGISFYGGTGGVRFWYNGSIIVRVDSDEGLTVDGAAIIDGIQINDSTHRSGLLEINNSLSASWVGTMIEYSSTALWALMGDQDNVGLYDEYNSDWIFQHTENAGLRLYYNGSEKLETYSTGIDVTGNVRATADVIAYYSDQRLKENITPISNALDKIDQITGIYYNPNEKAKELVGDDINERKVGIIAQELQKVLPEAVKPAPFDYDGNTGLSKSGENYITIQYEKVVPLLVQGIKETLEENNNLKNKVNYLENKLKTLEEKLNKIL